MKVVLGLVSLAVIAGLLIREPQSHSTDAAEPDAAEKEERVTRGLLALYDFQSNTGTVVKDRSGVGKPVDLRIADAKAVRRSRGALQIRSSTLIRSNNASKIITAIRRSNSLTVETWIRTATVDQSGPARVVTISKNSSERNMTLGQDGTGVEVRLRTTKTSKNGAPSLTTPSRVLAPKLTHIVYTRDRAGKTRIFVDGKQVATRTITGRTSNWNGTFRLALANELSGDRPWKGTFYLVAIYGRDLSTKEVGQNFQAGAGDGAAQLLLAEKKRLLNERLFLTRVVPILARRCLECHGWKTKKGGLDLSRKFAALRGGESGKAIVAGDSAKSLLWHSVKSNNMPKDREPLSGTEKRVLQVWIDDGALWPLDRIDAAKYAVKRRPNANFLRRLTVAEYIETVRVATGVDIGKDARKILPRDLRADGFSNTAYNLGVDLGHVQAYSALARMIVEKMNTAKFAAGFSKSNAFTDANLRTLIAAMGKRLLRGPLNEREVAAFLHVANAVKREKGDYKEAVGFVVEAMLQSPRFIYRIEIQRGTGKPRPVDDYELASRLSYILWGGPPDAELIRAADAGELSHPERAAAQVRRMLASPRSVVKSADFIAEWLNLARLDNLRPDPKKFPKWNPALAADMRAETLAFFHEIAWTKKRPLADLFNAKFTHVTPRLAKHYGFGETGASATGVTKRYDLTRVSERGGILTQGSVLTIGGDEASMVTRGLFVLRDILNGAVDDPPPGLDTTPVPTKPGLSQRAIAQTRIVNKSCGGCHSRFEPLAFGLEKYDGLGSFHNADHHGNKLRDDGEVLFPGQRKAIHFKTSAELMTLLAKSDRVQRTVTRKLTQWALGRPLTEEDTPLLDQIHTTARKTGGTYTAVMTAIVMSDLVRKTRTEKAASMTKPK